VSGKLAEGSDKLGPMFGNRADCQNNLPHRAISFAALAKSCQLALMADLSDMTPFRRDHESRWAFCLSSSFTGHSAVLSKQVAKLVAQNGKLFWQRANRAESSDKRRTTSLVSLLERKLPGKGGNLYYISCTVKCSLLVKWGRQMEMVPNLGPNFFLWSCTRRM